MNTSTGKERCFRCYKSSQKILLVGEGDFSFSACLARGLRTAKNIVATSYLNEDLLVQKHWTSVPHLEELERLGCLLLYEVDVYKMNTHPVLKKMKFDVIIFNFPHAGHYDYLCERDLELIEMHQDLVSAYFKSASKMLSEGGEVHIKHRDDSPYNKWNLVALASETGLKLKEKLEFEKSHYPGYHNKRGGDVNANKTFPIPIFCAFTFKFALDLPAVDDHLLKNDAARGHDDDLPKKDEAHDLHLKNDKDDHDHEHNLPKNDEVYHVLEMKNQDHGQHQAPLKNSDHILEMKDVHVGLPKNVHDELPNNNEVEVHDDIDVHVSKMKIHVQEEDAKNGVEGDLDVPELEMKDDVHEHHTKNVEVHEHDNLSKKDDLVVDDLYEGNVDLDVQVVEMKDLVEEERVRNNDVDDDLLRKKQVHDEEHAHEQHMKNDNDDIYEHKEGGLPDAMNVLDHDIDDVAEIKVCANGHDHHNIDAKMDRV